MTNEKKNTLDEAIVAELRDPSTTYAQVAVRFGIGLNRVTTLSKLNGCTRPRGKKPTKPKPTVEQAAQLEKEVRIVSAQRELSRLQAYLEAQGR